MLKVSEVASRLSLSPSKVYELVEKGKLPHYRIGGSIRVSEEQLSEFLNEAERRPVPVERKTGPRPRLRFVR
jgi:excisionase family DNA binding protein